MIRLRGGVKSYANIEVRGIRVHAGGSVVGGRQMVALSVAELLFGMLSHRAVSRSWFMGWSVC